MTELVGWASALGAVFVIACAFVLSNQLERHSHESVQAILRSNEMMLARLNQATPAARQAPEPVIGMVLGPRPRPSAGQPKNRTNSSATAPGASSAR